MPANKLSVSIVIYDLHENLLNQCIDSLRQSVQFSMEEGQLENWQLTLVDNGGNERALARFQGPNTTLIHNEDNVGFGIAHNQVIRESASTFHLILNPDVIMEISCISEAVKLLQQQPEIAMLGPYGAKPDGYNAHLCKRYPSVMDLFLRGFVPVSLRSFFSQRLARYEYHDLSDERPQEVELLSGCFLFARTGALQQVEGFDSGYFLYFEDFDLSIRMSKLGKIVFSPFIRITHFGGDSARKGATHIIQFCQSAFRFFNKNGWRFI